VEPKPLISLPTLPFAASLLKYFHPIKEIGVLHPKQESKGKYLWSKYRKKLFM
jgi:hypothetical protein